WSGDVTSPWPLAAGTSCLPGFFRLAMGTPPRYATASRVTSGQDVVNVSTREEVRQRSPIRRAPINVPHADRHSLPEGLRHFGCAAAQVFELLLLAIFPKLVENLCEDHADQPDKQGLKHFRSSKEKRMRRSHR